jgi:hypothetical protein
MINKIYGNQSVAEHSPHKSYSILLGDIYYEEVHHNVLARSLACVSCVLVPKGSQHRPGCVPADKRCAARPDTASSRAAR